IFAASGHARRRNEWADRRSSEIGTIAAAARGYRSRSGSVQSRVSGPYLGRAVRASGPSSGATGRALALFAAGPGCRAGIFDRRDRGRNHHRDRQQQSVRRACRDGAASDRVAAGRGHRGFNRSLNAHTRDGRIGFYRARQYGTDCSYLRRSSSPLGQYGQNLALIERRLGVVANSRGNQVIVEGSREATDQARRVLESLYERLKRGDDLVQGDVDGTIRLALSQGSLFDFDPAATRQSFEEINLRKRRVRARTAAQDAYIRALKRHALVFSTGPAGTGKTWLAVAYAAQLFERKEVDRIILSRPAVEAGERLGFLPGDMREKVDPYLRPIYDALYDLM